MKATKKTGFFVALIEYECIVAYLYRLLTLSFLQEALQSKLFTYWQAMQASVSLRFFTLFELKKHRNE